jgi:hypothetical protein
VLAGGEGCGIEHHASEEWIIKKIEDKKRYIKYITTRSDF